MGYNNLHAAGQQFPLGEQVGFVGTYGHERPVHFSILPLNDPAGNPQIWRDIASNAHTTITGIILASRTMVVSTESEKVDELHEAAQLPWFERGAATFEFFSAQSTDPDNATVGRVLVLRVSRSRMSIDHNGYLFVTSLANAGADPNLHVQVILQAQTPLEVSDLRQHEPLPEERLFDGYLGDSALASTLWHLPERTA